MSDSISTIKEVGENARRGINPVLLNAMKFISSAKAEYGTSNWDALEERSLIPPIFQTLSELWQTLKIPAVKPIRNSWWRLTKPIAGSCPFLPSCGQMILVATDGHQCLSLLPDGKHHIGLLQNFDPLEKLEMKGMLFEDYYGRRLASLPGRKKKNGGGKSRPRLEEFC